MSVLEEVNNLALDMNRAVMALVFFLKMPPRIDTDAKFLDLARTATADFRALQAKVVEANEAYPEAETSIMSLDLTIEAMQSYLVSTIKQMRAFLNEWSESQQNLTPGPSLGFLGTVTAGMHSLVESVVSSTKSIKKVINGEGLEPVKIMPNSLPEELPDIRPEHEQAVNSLLSNPSSENIDVFLGSSASKEHHSEPKISFQASKPSNSASDLSFASMLADAEREQRKAIRKAQKRENTPTKQVHKRSGIEVDPETLDSIVLHLSDLTSIFFTESNYFGQQPDHLSGNDLVAMSDLAEKQQIANELALSLQTSSIDMESFLNKHHQNSLAKLTNLHMKDIISAMKDVFSSAPNVSWSTLHQLDVAIKDYATTIKDVVQLASPEYEEVYIEDEGEDSGSDFEDEPTPLVKATRKLTKEEEMLQAFDGFADALDALDIDMMSSTPSKHSALDFGSPVSTNGSGLDSKNGDIPLFGPLQGQRPVLGSFESGASSPSSFPSSLGQPLSWTSSDVPNGYHREGRSHTVAGSSGDSTVIGSFQSNSSFLSSHSSHTTQTATSSASQATSSSDSLPNTPRSESRVTLQFPGLRPRSTISVSEKHAPMLSSSPQPDSPITEDRRATLHATKSSSFIEATYEIADEAIRQAEVSKIVDRWSDMQARSEEQRTIPQDPSTVNHDGDWENSKVKAALKFMSKKVGDIRKKASGVAGNRSSSNLSSSSSSNLKRRSIALASSPSSSSALSSSSGSIGAHSGSNSPTNPRRSMQLTGINADDPRLSMFEAPDDDSNLRISPETDSILAGTIEKLVQRLTHDSMPDPDFVLNFLTTHKCFTTSGQLLELLCLRWDTAAPPDQDPKMFETSRLPSIRLRVYNVLKTWMERFWSDFQNEPELIDRLKIFAAAMYHGGLSSASQTLTKLIQKNLANEAPNIQLPEPPQVFDFVRRSRREAPIAFPSTAAPISSDAITGGSTPRGTPGTMVPAILTSLSTSLPRPLTILDFHPAELARQLSYMEFELWKQVKNVELLDVAWTKKDKETRSPNVLNMIRFSNHITNWMISEILLPDDPKERSVVLNRCIWMVKTLIELRNFNGCMEALSAFHSSAIYRLKSTWNLLPSSSWSLYERLEKLMSPDANFKTYRNEYDRSVPPFTPYLGTHLSDLLFLEETLPRFVDGTQLINFAKMEKTSQFIQTLELSQQIPYSFIPVPIIMSYIKDYVGLSPKDAYTRSLAVEARKQKNRPNSSYQMSRVASTASNPENAVSPPNSKEIAPGST